MEITINRSHIEDQIASLLYAWGYVRDDEDVEVDFDAKIFRTTQEHIPIVFKTTKRIREEVSTY